MQKLGRREFSIEKVIKRKSNKLYTKWNNYDDSFNSSIDDKNILT